MSRKAREDKSAWHVPGIYAFTGGYGPYKPKQLENCLVLLTSTLSDDGSLDVDGKNAIQRHAMFKFAAQAQKLLLHENSKQFQDLIVIDVADMVAEEGVLGDKNSKKSDIMKDMIQKENEEADLVKGFGRTLLRAFQRLELRNVVLMAEGEMCSVLLKLYHAYGDQLASDIYLLHPIISAGFINTHLVPMGMTRRTQTNTPLNIHLTFKDQKSCDKRSGEILLVCANLSLIC